LNIVCFSEVIINVISPICSASVDSTGPATY
jgi:hypothetical protein